MSLDFEIRSRPKRLSCATLPSLPSTGNLACLRYWVSIVQDRYQQEICHALRYWVAKTATNRKFVMPCSIGLPRLLPTGNCWLACGIGFPQNSYQQEFFWLACGNGLPRDFSQQEIFGVPAVFGCQVILKGFYPIVSEKHNSCEA